MNEEEIEDKLILHSFLNDDNFVMFRGIDHPQPRYKLENLKKEINGEIELEVDYLEEQQFIAEFLEKNEGVLYWEYLPDFKIGYSINEIVEVYEPTFCVYFNKGKEKNSDNIEISLIDLFPYKDLLNIPLCSYDQILEMEENEFQKYEEFMEEANHFVQLYNLIDDYCKQNGMSFYLMFNNSLLNIKKTINIY